MLLSYVKIMSTYLLIAEPVEFLRHRRRKCGGDEVYFVEKGRGGFSSKLSCSFWLLLLTYHVDSGSRPAQNSVNMQRGVITGCPRPISVKVSSWCV